jgi:DnaJ-domain-containing protein 1
MAARLSPEERDRRAKERRQNQWARMKSGAAYQQYDPTDGGHGSQSQWQNTADDRLYNKPMPAINADLVLLGLSQMADTKTLTRAYRFAARSAHPDLPGGSEEKFKALKAAYDRLIARV